MYRLNTDKFRAALHRSGYRSIKDLAAQLGIHRNAIYYYLNGRNVLPDVIARVLDAVSLPPGEAFERIETLPGEQLPASVAKLVDNLQTAFPRTTFILFGSRASGRARRYSDFDIGAYRQDKIETDEYLDMIALKNDLEEQCPYFIDLVNLTAADLPFLAGIRDSLVFLGGKQTDFLDLRMRCYEKK